jgi:hypothetical protein
VTGDRGNILGSERVHRLVWTRYVWHGVYTKVFNMAVLVSCHGFPSTHKVSQMSNNEFFKNIYKERPCFIWTSHCIIFLHDFILKYFTTTLLDSHWNTGAQSLNYFFMWMFKFHIIYKLTRIQLHHFQRVWHNPSSPKMDKFFRPQLTNFFASIVFQSSKPPTLKVYQNLAIWSRSFAHYASNFVFMKETLASNLWWSAITGAMIAKLLLICREKLLKPLGED